MKKMIVLILAAGVLLTFVSCSISESNGEKGMLIVEGTTITSNTIVYYEYAAVSVCDVLSALGFVLTWDNESVVSFYCNDEKYIISIPEKTLVRDGENCNYLLPAPGSQNYICDVVDGELIVDNNTLLSLFNVFIKYPVYIEFDSENASVIITKK